MRQDRERILIHEDGDGRGGDIADDGGIEAIEHRTKPIVGVQFHPERLVVRDGNVRALKLIRAALEGKRPSELAD